MNKLGQATTPNGILKKMEYKLFLDYLGKESAHHRLDLLVHCQDFFPDLSDRQMRKIYGENFCIGHSRDGIYLADDPAEIDRMIAIMKKVIDTYREKILRFELQKERLIRMKMEEAEQLRLFKPI